MVVYLRTIELSRKLNSEVVSTRPLLTLSQTDDEEGAEVSEVGVSPACPSRLPKSHQVALNVRQRSMYSMCQSAATDEVSDQSLQKTLASTM